MKNILAKILAAVTVATLIFTVSCATSEVEETVPEFDTEYEVDLTGLTFRFGTYWTTQYVYTEGFSSAGDKINARRRELEKTFGCKFEVLQYDLDGSRIMQEVAAGMDTVDIIDNETCKGPRNLYYAGLLVPLEDISTIDLNDEKWGPEKFRRYGIFDGKAYGFYQYEWEFVPEYAGVLLFNGNLLIESGQTYPYEYQENGEWNWKNFKKMLETCSVNLDSSLGIKPMGTDNTGRDILAAMFSNGSEFVVQDSSGQYKINLNNSKCIDALDFLAELYGEDLYGKSTMTDFNEERSVFIGCETYYGTHHYEGYDYPTDHLENLGMVTFPYGPAANSSTVSAFVFAGRRLNYVVSASPNEIDDIGIVMDFLFEPLDDSGGWKSYSSSVIFHHSDDYDNFCYMLENVNYDYSFEIPSMISSLPSKMTAVLLGKSSASEVLKSIEDIAQAELDENMNK